MGWLIAELFAGYQAWLLDAPMPPVRWVLGGGLVLLGAVLIVIGERGQVPWLLRRLAAGWLASPRVARVYAVLAGLLLLVALGQQLQVFGRLGPYLPAYWLYQQFSFLTGLRAPFRAAFLAEVSFAVLVGIGAARAIPWLQSRFLRSGGGTKLGAWGVSLVIVTAMTLEFLGPAIPPQPLPVPGSVHRWLAEQPGNFGIVELPQPEKMWQTARGQWLSVYHWKARVTGHNGLVPGPIKHLHKLASPVLGDEFINYLLDFFPVRHLLLDLDALSEERRAWALEERLPELGGVLEPVERLGSVQVLRVNNGGELGSLRRRFPRWMVRGILRIELAEPLATDRRAARIVARLGSMLLEPARVQPGQRVVEIVLPSEIGPDELPWLYLRLTPRDGQPVRVKRIQFIWADGQRYP